MEMQLYIWISEWLAPFRAPAADVLHKFSVCTVSLPSPWSVWHSGVTTKVMSDFGSDWNLNDYDTARLAVPYIMGNMLNNPCNDLSIPVEHGKCYGLTKLTYRWRAMLTQQYVCPHGVTTGLYSVLQHSTQSKSHASILDGSTCSNEVDFGSIPLDKKLSC